MKREIMTITLTPDLQERIDEKVRNGEFESADAMVEQALAFFLDYEREAMDDAEFRDTKAAVGEALEQADRGQGISLEDFDRSMRAKYGISR
jgi:Arc/MetJ-type ribon-helix-helix transcriptional regulator